jgi:hypothetical protein
MLSPGGMSRRRIVAWYSYVLNGIHAGSDGPTWLRRMETSASTAPLDCFSGRVS